jgi:hypothetical protein
MEIARRHLGTALALFLDDLDPVAVQTLACSGSEIAEHLSKVAGEEPFSKHMMEEFPDLDKKKLQGLRNNTGTHLSTPRPTKVLSVTTALYFLSFRMKKTTIRCFLDRTII